MTRSAVRVARWSIHANAVNPSVLMRRWLTDRMSLTKKLIAHGTEFRVQHLNQVHALCLKDEVAMIGLTRIMRIRQREVLLLSDGRPLVFAHTVVPLDATASDWPFFGTLGERSLGTTLFGDPLVSRGALQFARLEADHPLAKRARLATKIEAGPAPLFARRCLFRRKAGCLLVTEVFLPGIAAVGTHCDDAAEIASPYSSK